MSWANAAPKLAASVFSRPVFAKPKIDWAHLVVLDYETYWDADYTLRKLSTSEYVRDPRFKEHMVGVKVGRRKTRVIPTSKIPAFLKTIDWKTHDLLCHNTAFDGFILSHHHGIVPRTYYDTLSMARGLHSNDIGAGLDEVAQYYGVGNKTPNVLEQSKSVPVLPKALYIDMAAYCAMDVELTLLIFEKMLDAYPAKELALIDMTVRMFCDPVLKIDIPRVEVELKRELDEREALLLSIDTSEFLDKDLKLVERTLPPHEKRLLVAKKIVGSNEKFADLLRAEGIEPPTKISPAWMKKPAAERDDADKYSYAFAKDDQDFIELPDRHEEWGADLNLNSKKDVAKLVLRQERIRQLVDCRLAVKSTTNITRAQRFLTAGADGMPLPVGYAYYRAHCVPGDVEVLTRLGWQRIEDWGGGEIAQVSPDQSIEFLQATRFAGPPVKEWVRIEAPYMKGDFTFGHTMPYLKQKSFAWATETAREFANMAIRDVPLAGKLIAEGAITAHQMRVLTMVQADGSFEEDAGIGRRLAVFVKKPRKIKRARQLFSAAGVPFEEQTYDSWPGYVRFIVRQRDYPAWLTPQRKFFGAWLLDSADEAREALIDELHQWDGWFSKGGMLCYSTSDQVNAEWISTLCHLTGRCASTYIAPPSGNRRASHTISIRQRNRGLVRGSHMRVEVHTQARDSFCATTQTGFWLARSQGRIFVTGNTGRWGGNNKMNMQNLTRGGELRQSILAPKGHVLVVGDSGQIECRVNGWLWGQADLMEAFTAADAGVGRDAYCNFADHVYGRVITKADATERHVGKASVLGLGFQMGAPKFQITLAKGANGGPPVFFDLDRCKTIVNTYRRKNYKIVAGWEICKGIIEDMAAGIPGTWKCISWEKECIWLPNGMRLKYPNLKMSKGEKGWDEWSYQAKDMRKKIYGGLLCENIIQALARIIVAEQLLMVAPKRRVVMITHDEGVVVARIRAAEAAYRELIKAMRTPLPWCMDLPLNSEGGYATNYSK